jgi:hypothetical protein
VLEALQPLRYTAMRYPGGNFASGLPLDGRSRPPRSAPGGARAGLAKPGTQPVRNG